MVIRNQMRHNSIQKSRNRLFFKGARSWAKKCLISNPKWSTFRITSQYVLPEDINVFSFIKIILLKNKLTIVLSIRLYKILWNFKTIFGTLYKFFGNLSTNFSEIWVQIFRKFEYKFFGNLSTNFLEIWVQFFGNLSTNFSEIWVQIFWKFEYKFFGNMSTNFSGNLSTNFLEIWVQIFRKFEYKFFGNLITVFGKLAFWRRSLTWKINSGYWFCCTNW